MPEISHVEFQRSPDIYEQLGDWAIMLADRAEDIASIGALKGALSDGGLDLALRVVRGYGTGGQNQDRSHEFYGIAAYDQDGRYTFSAEITTKPKNTGLEDSPAKLFTILRTTGSGSEQKTETLIIPMTTTGNVWDGESLGQELVITNAEDISTSVTDPASDARVIASLFRTLSETAQQLPRAA